MPNDPSWMDQIDSTMPEVIAVSRRRCQRAGLEPHIHLAAHRISEAELEQRLRANRDFVAVAARHLAWLSTISARAPHAIVLVDAEGIVLHACGPAIALLQEAALLPGYDWSEPRMGTNGAGTCLVEGRPVVVSGTDHFAESLHAFCGTAAPIRSPSRTLLGAVNFATADLDGSEERLAVVTYIAAVIEEELRGREMARVADSLQGVARLSAFAAHELATPLATLQHSLGLLRDYDLGEKPTRIVERCCRVSQQMEEVTACLRLLGGANPPLNDQVDLLELAREVAAAMGLPPHYEIAVEAETGGPTIVRGNSRLLFQALRNLITNAVDAMPHGGAVGVCLRPGVDGVRMTVRDDGPGIPPDVRPILFGEPFTTKPQGSGLGLLLVRTIVERVHGGILSFTPAEPHGAEFHLDLPVRH